MIYLVFNKYHRSINSDDPYTRIKNIVKFYLSGFYKKPKGLKKPYNPVLGELFRCYWDHPSTSSKTFYIAEQVINFEKKRLLSKYLLFFF